jgi:hypothetical protein
MSVTCFEMRMRSVEGCHTRVLNGKTSGEQGAPKLCAVHRDVQRNVATEMIGNATACSKSSKDELIQRKRKKPLDGVSQSPDGTIK